MDMSKVAKLATSSQFWQSWYRINQHTNRVTAFGVFKSIQQSEDFHWLKLFIPLNFVFDDEYT